MRVLLLGATGVVGRRTAAELARHEEIEALFVASRTMDDVGRLADSLGGAGGKVRPLVLDAADPQGLRGAFAEMSVVASCAGPAYVTEEPAVVAAIGARVPYVSTCDDHAATEALYALADQTPPDTTIVSGCAMSPGITNLLVERAASELSEPDEIHIAVAASSADPSGPAAALHLVAAFSTPAPMVADGEPVIERPATEPRLVYFPEPVGWTETFWCGHPEVLTMSGRYPTVRTLTFRMGLNERAVMDAVRAAVATGVVASEPGRHAFLRLAEPVRPLLQRIPPAGPPWTAIRVDVWGHRGGKRASISFGVVDHLVNLASIPLARAAIELGAGRVTSPGIKTPEEVFEVSAFLRHLVRRGVRVARLEPHSL